MRLSSTAAGGHWPPAPPLGTAAACACGASLFGKAAKLRRVMRRAGVPPARTVYVGDETRDIEAALAVAAQSAAVTWGYATPEALRACRPSTILQDVADIGRLGLGQATGG